MCWVCTTCEVGAKSLMKVNCLTPAAGNAKDKRIDFQTNIASGLKNSRGGLAAIANTFFNLTVMELIMQVPMKPWEIFL